MFVQDPKTAAKHAEDAALVLAQGNLAQAETLAHLSRLRGPSAIAENVLGKLALQLGRADVALDCLRRATALDPRFKPAQRNLAAAQRLEQQQRTQPPPDLIPGGPERYLLIRAWGFGFWADVDHVIGALLLAELTGRTPVVHWGPESLWVDPAGPDGAPPSEGWSQFFQPVSARTIEDVEAACDGGVYPPKWSRNNLREPPPNRFEGQWSRCGALLAFNRPERVVVSDFHAAVVSLLAWTPAGHRLAGAGFRAAHHDLFRKYLRVQPEIREQADAFVRDRIPTPEHTVAVHIRGTDKVIESPHLASLASEYDRRLDTLVASDPALQIFLMTDDAGARSRMESRYGQRIVCTESRRASGVTGVHYQDHANRRQLGIEVVRDVLIATRCSALLGLGSSNVTLAAAHMGDWPEDRVTLLDVPLHAYPSPVLHARN